MNKKLIDKLRLWRIFSLRALATLGAILIMLELGGIWREVHEMRKEQVKNALYTLPEQTRTRLTSTGRGRLLQNTVAVTGSVEIDGDVHVEQPIEVEVEH